MCKKTKKKTILRDSVGEPDPWEESLRIGFFVFFWFFCFFLVFLVFEGFLCIIGDVSVSFPFVRFFGIF